MRPSSSRCSAARCNSSTTTKGRLKRPRERTLINASITLADKDDRYFIRAVGKNLGDKSYAQMLASGGDYIYRSVPRDDGRYFGVQLRKDF